MTLRTEYEFVLPRGYVDEHNVVHRRGTMRLATARDELEPLRDPTVNGPDDPRLTILVLARTIETLGTMTLVTPHEIEGLFAADLAYLQDFYGVINFGTDADIKLLLDAQAEMQREIGSAPNNSGGDPAGDPTAGAGPHGESNGSTFDANAGRRSAIEEVSARTQ